VLTCGSIFMAWHAVERLLAPQPVMAEGMLYLALLGIVVNGLAFRITHAGSSHNEQAVSLHLLEDVLGWVAVLIASIVMLFVDVPWLDAALSLGISLYILWGALRRIRSTALVFLQRVPTEVDLDQVRQGLSKVNGVSAIEDLHVWSTDGQQLIVTLSVRRASPTSDSARLRKDLTIALGDLARHHVTIEILDATETSMGCEPIG
jgi:cobalt-zinc-cadmium efflux system protein